MNRRERGELCDRAIGQLNLPAACSYRDACRQVGELMSQLLKARVELRFVALRNTRLSGGTVLRPDGSYIIYCAKSRYWYHRLQILLHELAHLLLGHQPITLEASEGLRRFAPHLPGKLTRIIAGRTELSQDDERDAEELADALLERLTEQRRLADPAATDRTAHVRRVADALEHRQDRGARDDL